MERDKSKDTPSKITGLHIYPHPVYIAALTRLARALRMEHPDFQDKKKVSQTRAFEFILEQLLGDRDEELQEYIELRNKQRELMHAQEGEVRKNREHRIARLHKGRKKLNILGNDDE